MVRIELRWKWKVRLDDFNGKLPKELSGVQDEYDFVELKMLGDTIDIFKDRMYQGYEIFVEAGPYGGVNYRVLDMIMDKASSGETLTSIENFILSEGARMMGGERAPLFDFDVEIWKLYGGFDSPYLQLFNKFTYDLKNILADAKLLSRTANGRVYDTALEAIVKGESLRYTRKDMSANTHKRPNIGEKSLDLWFVRIEKAIQDSIEIINKEEVIIRVTRLFDSYYHDSGYANNNQILRDARHTIFKIGEVLLETELIGSNTEDNINKALGGHNVDHLYKDYASNPYYLPKLGEGSAIESLRKYVRDHIEGKIPQERVNDIYSLITTFEGKVRMFRSIRDTFENMEDFEVTQTAEEQSTEDINLLTLASTWREKLILDLQMIILKYSDFMKKNFISLRDFSRLLFGEDTFITQNFWHDITVEAGSTTKTRTIDRRPELYNLYRIKLMTQIMKVSSFEAIGLSISPAKIKELRQELLEKVDEYIFNNPQGLVMDQPTRGGGALMRTYPKQFLTPENDVVSWIWLAYAVHDDNPSLTFEDITKKGILSSFLTSYLSKGNRNIPAKALRKFAVEFIGYYREVLAGTHQNTKLDILQSEKLMIYETAFKQIFTYMKQRGISYTRRIYHRIQFDRDGKYNSLFYDKLVKAYHNVFLFSEQLGFDPLTFTPLKGGEGGAFEITFSESGTPIVRYVRHHIDSDLKRSLFLQDLIMTDKSLHATYEKIARDHGVQYVYNLKKAFGELVSKSGDIDADIIEDVFAKHGVSEIYEQYWEDNVNDYLAEFNARKDDFHGLGLDGFMENMGAEYPHFYNRFYTRFQRDALTNRKYLMLLVTPIPLGQSEDQVRSYCDFLAADYFFSQFPRLVNKFNYDPHIFKYWFGD